MAADDDQDCPAHTWKIRTVVLSGDGAHIQSECLRCGTLTIEGPDDLSPGLDKLQRRRHGPGHQPPPPR